MRIDIYTRSEQLPELMDGSVLHSALMFRIYERSRISKPCMLVAYDSTGNETAHILVIKRRRFIPLPFLWCHWYTVNGEGVYCESCTNREDIFGMFLEKVIEMSGFRHTFIKVQNIEDSRFAYGILRKNGFVPTRDQRLYISLHSKAPQERLTRAYRAHIRKAENDGVTWHRATTQQEINEGINLLHNYYISKVRRLPDKETLNMMLRNDDGTLCEKAKMFVVTYKGKTIGSSICLYDKDCANLAYSCGLRKSHPMQHPGIMAIWAALNNAYRHGYAHFEFLEARALPLFHKKFITTLLNYGGKEKGTLRWFRFKWSWINKILRAIYV